MDIILYTKENCDFCAAAKSLVRNKQIPFTEYKLNEDFTKQILQSKFPEASTYPVIVIDNFRVGGFQELKETLNREMHDTRKLLNEGN